MRVFDVGIKITQSETKQSNMAEELRQAQTATKMLKSENKNLEEIIECHNRENQRLMFELKKYTKGKILK